LRGSVQVLGRHISWGPKRGRNGRDSLVASLLLLVTPINDDAALWINDVMRAAAASLRILEIEIHVSAVGFPGDPNDEARKVSIDSLRIEAGDAQRFIGGKLPCE
jgi:hypothetical protein